MVFHTLEHIVDSMRGWKRPLYSYSRSYSTKYDVNRRIRWLIRTYGDENIAQMPVKDDPSTVEVYVRVR